MTLMTPLTRFRGGLPVKGDSSIKHVRLIMSSEATNAKEDWGENQLTSASVFVDPILTANITRFQWRPAII